MSRKANHYLYGSISWMLLTACLNVSAEQAEMQRLYDFDEKVHYKQTQIDTNNYHLEIQSDDYSHFKNQSVFLLRHANRLCRDNPFMLKVTEGVQEYERFPTKPRAYQPPLSVFVQCEMPAEKTSKK
ncbi:MULTISPECIES: hypothetical protein [unclassified Pseudoalteromonas]|jgi:hypothetical protein|uniref:hypothetical protein n=2 Tax=unclassified Pseudoalteromonas TaxID=194690 RepID=UPI00055EB639|nr:hypothetical protein B1F84_14470 [Pseudoalteromonas sp. DL-6]|tara:strand:- start:138 stop:518 length:381 start_codon:yes stop_codon:yes gene_type:complete